MKRTELKRRTPLSRTGTLGLQSHARLAAGEPKRRKSSPAKKATLKPKRPKMTPIRKSARGEECTLRFPGICNGDTSTTVWCHSNRLEDGKGMGIKARDEEGCYGCSSCHAWLDGGYAGHVPRSTVEAFFDLARGFSQQILRRKGLIK